MNVVASAEVSTFSSNKRLLLFSGAALTVLALIKFKKQLKNLITLSSSLVNTRFAPVNQSKKITHTGCGVWENVRNNKFDENERILISNPEQLKQKLQNMKNAGLQELQICTDYDQTITAFGSKQIPQPATFGLMRESKYVSEEFRVTLRGLYHKYHPYEVDSQLNKEQKSVYMKEWNQGVSDAFKHEGILKSNILKALEESNLSFRHNFDQFLRALAYINLPFYVISGGISPILQTMLDSILDTQKDYPNFLMFCNEVQFNENNIVTALDMVVNTICKDEKVNKKDFNLRKNTLLFGDYHHDIFMQTQLGSENVISILFCRDTMAGDIENLQKDWDIIVRGDGSYIIHQAIVQYIAGNKWCDVKLSGDAEIQFANNPIYNEIKSLLV